MPGYDVAPGPIQPKNESAAQPLWWQPGGLERHATRASVWRDGEVFTALRGEDVAADSWDLSWFFSTCPACYAVANSLAEALDD